MIEYGDYITSDPATDKYSIKKYKGKWMVASPIYERPMKMPGFVNWVWPRSGFHAECDTFAEVNQACRTMRRVVAQWKADGRTDRGKP